MNNSADWQQIRRQIVPGSFLNPSATEMRRLGLILLVAMLHGLAYVFLLPPWQHYDEPNHFEYVWLMARAAKEGRPSTGDFDPELSFHVIESMQRNGFYSNSQQPPAPPELTADLQIPGYSQLGEPPLYYLLAAQPTRVFSPLNIESQLYASRLVSLAFFLLVVLSAWGAARELTFQVHPLRWLAPAFLALLPGLAELMTAVNNDSLAIAACSLFFWASTRVLSREFELLNILWVLAAAALAFFSKNTAYVVVGLFPIVMLFALLRGRNRRVAWTLVTIGAAALLLLGLAWDDAAAWYRGVSQPTALRQPLGSAPHGENILALDVTAPVVPGWSPPVYQIIPPFTARPAFGNTVSLGVWMWADEPVSARLPRLTAASAVFSETVNLSKSPQFFAYNASLPTGSDRIWIALDPQPGETSASGARTIFYDGLTLSLGALPVQVAPIFMDGDLKTGVWSETPFENLVRNPSFEKGGVRVRPWLDNLAVRFLPDNARPSQLLASISDRAGAGYFYRTAARHLFETFWARFGWGHVPLVWKNAYWIPVAITLLSALGLFTGALRLRRELPGAVILVMGLALAAAGMMALARGAAYLAVPGYYYSTARHAYPVILPAGLALAAGWLGLPGRSTIGRIVLILLMSVLVVISFYSIGIYYGRF